MGFADMLEKASARLRSDFGETESISHRLSKGETREGILRSFLTKYLPGKFSLGSGEIYSTQAEGQVSPQTDIVIYDGVWSWGLFGPQDVPVVYPADAVYAAIEVKSDVDRRALDDACSKIQAIKALPRQVPEQGVFQIDPYTTIRAGPGIKVKSPPHRGILGILFGYRSSMDDCDLFHAFVEEQLGRVEPQRLDLVCILDQCVMTHRAVYGLPVWSTDGHPIVLHAEKLALPLFVALLNGALRSMRLCYTDPLQLLKPVLEHMPFHAAT